MVITTKLPSSSSRTDPPDVLLEGMVGTPEDHIQALNEATTKMLQDSTPERVAEIARCFQRPEMPLNAPLPYREGEFHIGDRTYEEMYPKRGRHS